MGKQLKVKRLFVGDYVTLIFFFILLFFTLFPLLWMFLASLKTSAEINLPKPTFFPKNVFFGNYKKIFTDQYFLGYFRNSVIVAVGVTIIAVSGSMLMGFVFAKFKFPLKNVFFYMILATIMIPSESTIVPLYSLARKLNMINTYQGMMLPSIISSFGIFYMKQNMEQIPDSLIEAAKIDGAGNWYIFFHIIVPLSTSAISVLALLLFLTEWSAYLWPLIMASKKEMFLLEIGLTYLQDEYIIDYGMMMAGCVVALIPALILYIFFRNNIMEGIASTGIKG